MACMANERKWCNGSINSGQPTLLLLQAKVILSSSPHLCWVAVFVGCNYFCVDCLSCVWEINYCFCDFDLWWWWLVYGYRVLPLGRECPISIINRSVLMLVRSVGSVFGYSLFSSIRVSSSFDHHPLLTSNSNNSWSIRRSSGFGLRSLCPFALIDLFFHLVYRHT